MLKAQSYLQFTIYAFDIFSGIIFDIKGLTCLYLYFALLAKTFL